MTFALKVVKSTAVTHLVYNDPLSSSKTDGICSRVVTICKTLTEKIVHERVSRNTSTTPDPVGAPWSIVLSQYYLV